MRKNYIFLVVLLSTVFCFGQNIVTLDHTCYKQLHFTVKNDGWHKDYNAYSWWIMVKNNYNQAVTFKYDIYVGDEPHRLETNSNAGFVASLDPGKSHIVNWGPLYALLKKSSSSEFTIVVRDVCFKGYSCYENGYFDCDGRQVGGHKKTQMYQDKTNQEVKEEEVVDNFYNYCNKYMEGCNRLGELLSKKSVTNSEYKNLCTNVVRWSKEEVKAFVKRVGADNVKKEYKSIQEVLNRLERAIVEVEIAQPKDYYINSDKNTSSSMSTTNDLRNNNTSKSENNSVDYSSLIIGKWKMIAITRLNGENLPFYENNVYFSDFKANGNLVNLNPEFFGEVHTDMRWEISKNTLVFIEDQYGFGGKFDHTFRLGYEIFLLNESTLVIKYNHFDLGDILYQYKKIR